MFIEFAYPSTNSSARSGMGRGSCAVRSQSHRALSGALGAFRRMVYKHPAPLGPSTRFVARSDHGPTKHHSPSHLRLK
jgi:hypothetical protein